MLQISNTSRLLCGVILITVPSIQFGGVFLLKMIRGREPGYLDNPVRRALFRAGHAHAGVLVILSLLLQLLSDAIVMSPAFEAVARLGAPLAAILMPLGFFLSVLSPRAERPGGAIALVYIGAVCLALSVLVLGVLLVRAGMPPAGLR